jgi:hypothetical protein
LINNETIISIYIEKIVVFDLKINDTVSLEDLINIWYIKIV